MQLGQVAGHKLVAGFVWSVFISMGGTAGAKEASSAQNRTSQHSILTVACGADPSYYPGGDHSSSVLSGSGSAQDYVTPLGNNCIQTPLNPCIKPQSECGDGGRADVILKVTINCNNNQLVGNRVQSGISVNANNTVCRGNLGFADGNINHVIEPFEVGVPLTCN